MSRHVPALAIAAAVVLATMAGGAADQKNVEWRAYSGDKGSTKYSPLDQINKDTVKNLRIVWRQSGMPEELRPHFPNVQASTNYENTPLMIDGLLYMSTAVGTVAALDPKTGKVVWYDVPPQREGQPPARGASTRGVAYWTDGKRPAHHRQRPANLVALNAKTGEALHGVRRQAARSI